MHTDAISVERVTPDGASLDAINRVVEGAVMGWRLAERVKRLVLPSYLYSAAELTYLDVIVARETAGMVVGVATLESAAAIDCPHDRRGLLLHGLYIAPAYQRRGIGKRLLDEVFAVAHAARVDGVLVKAQHAAEPFFVARGSTVLVPTDPQRQYAHRLWRAVRRA